METLIGIKNSEIPVFSKFEEEGVTTLKRYIEEYLRADNLQKDSCPKLRKYLETAKVDDYLLLKYIKGRKHQVDVAWDTLRRYAENRFSLYPDVFLEVVPQKVQDLIAINAVGLLKNRDKYGRRIMYFDMTKWDADKYTLDDLTTLAVIGAEKYWKDSDIIEKGVVFVENTEGFGISHAKQHSMYKMMRIRNIFLHSFPLSIQGIFYLRVPYFFTLIFRMTKHLFPKKMKSRMFLYSPNEIPTDLYEIAPPEILPTWAGGKLSAEEASESLSFYNL